MLELLCLRKGTTLTKEMFLNQLYGGMDEPEIKIIDVFMCKLRKKLADASDGKDYIETIWGRGYRVREPHSGRLAAPFRAQAGNLPLREQHEPCACRNQWGERRLKLAG